MEGAALTVGDWHPEVRILGVDDAGSASGAIVVIDVIRAFTTAAVAFANGAARIWCVEGLDEAVVLGRSTVGSVVMGEERGIRPDRFDLGNSPTEPARDVVGGRTVVQRTSNGTRALVAAIGAEQLFAMAASNVTATYRCLGLLRPLEVSLVCSGSLSDDRACAEHLHELIKHGSADPSILTERIVASTAEHMERWKLHHVRAERDRFLADIAVCAAADTVSFAMAATRQDRYVELRRVNV